MKIVFSTLNGSGAPAWASFYFGFFGWTIFGAPALVIEPSALWTAWWQVNRQVLLARL